MDLSNLFKQYLISLDASAATVKNYVADVKRFIRYFEERFSLTFKPGLITWEMIDEYRSELVSEIGERSVERHLSSLRRFFQFSIDQGLIETNPCSTQPAPQEVTVESESKIKEFKDFLYRTKASDLTIKNYIIDIKQFLAWFELSSITSTETLSPSQIIARLSTQIIASYKERLLDDSDLSISSINRKLSSLRTYFRWAIDSGLLPADNISEDIKIDQGIDASHVKQHSPITPLVNYYKDQHEPQKEETETEQTENPDLKTYSPIPPVRLTQKMLKGINLAIDSALVNPLANLVSYCQYVLWTRSGGKIFEAIGIQTKTVSPVIRYNSSSVSQIKNIKPSFYAPLSSTVSGLPFHRRVLFHIFNTRPVWYRKYQSVALIRILHTGIIMSILAIAIILIYDQTLGTQKTGVLGDTSQEESSRRLSFKGTLADDNGNPIRDITGMRFSIYSHAIASGEAQLWQEVQYVTPDESGDFIVSLGQERVIPEEIFLEGNKLYVGVSLGTGPELSPRQPIANVALAKDSQMLQGLLPITDSHAGSENVVLALDSSGNLTLGGEKSHIFQATGGTFQIRGQHVLLSTLRGSNGNVTFRPDGQGIIDIQKPIQNTTEDITTDGPPGAVRIDDLLSVNATGSGQSLLTINQNGFGPLISASSGGVAKFTVDNIGSTTIGHNLTINGTDIGTNRPVFSLLNRNVTIVNFAGESEAVTIGSQSGTTTIRNARTAISGDLTVSGKIGATFFGTDSGITFSGGGNHTITASSGNLRLGTTLLIGENANIIAETINGTNNLGSEDKPFDTLYVNNIVSPSLNFQNAASLWLRDQGVLRPSNITDDITLGGNATSSALVKLGGTTGSNTFFHNGGNLGIGTANPVYKLHISEARSSDAVALIENADTGSDADVLRLKIGTLSPSTTNKFISFLDGNNQSLGSIQASGSGGVSYLTTGSDFAEYFRKEDPQEDFVAGDVVCLGQTGGVTGCDSIHTTIVGVITDRAGFVGSSDKANNTGYALVGLQGQIPVRVLANEHIQPGDSLSLSGTKGIVTRTTRKGQIIGRALESSAGKTTVLAYVSPIWHDPNVSVTDSGNLSIVPIHSEDEETSSYFVMDTVNNRVLGSIGVFSEAISGSIKAGFINARDIVVEGGIKVGGTIASSAVEAGQISAETVRATESLITRAAQADSIEAGTIVSPIIESEKIKVSILSPVSDESLTVHLKNKRVEFVSSDHPDAPVATIDNQGNASFSGKIVAKQATIETGIQTTSLSAENILVSGEATVSGKLIAKEIIAERLQLPEETVHELTNKLTAEMVERIASLLSQGVSEDTISDILSPVISDPEHVPQLATTEPIATPSAENLSYSELNLSYSESSSISALARFVPDLTSDKLTVNHGLMVFGVTSLADAAVANLLSVGSTLTIQNSSINTLGTDLELQPLRQGNISLMAGRIMIDTEGNALFNENVTVHGTLYAHTLKPLPGQDLNLSLTGNEKVAITDASQSARLTISSIGDIIASGSARFAEDVESRRGTFLDVIAKNLKVVRGAEADTSLTETVASSSAGVATIVPGEIERTIISPYVSEESLIYLTPASETYQTMPYIARQSAQNDGKGTKGSFTIRIQQPLRREIKVNWWIIN